MSDNEKDIQALIKRYSEQQSAFQPNPQFTGNTNQGINSHQGIDNQGVISKNTPLPPDIMIPPKPIEPVPVGNICPQCNMMHPPLRPGEKCPNAITKAINEESSDPTININKYLVSLQNILISQIEIKKIKDIKKLYENIRYQYISYLL